MGTKYQIKICGIKDLTTLELCQKLGVDFVGLNFSPRSPRKIDPIMAEELLSIRHLPGFPKLVFLFFENSTEEIQKITEQFQPDLVQLIRGDQWVTKDLWDSLTKKKQLLPAIRIQSPIDSDETLEPNSELVILDSFQKGLGGGSGHTFPWEYVTNVKRPYLLAGGITPDNVKLALDTLHPFGIDVASGVETDGKKDPNKIIQLVQNVRNL
ncbi:Phosphoribosylanthranilate isomerase [Leptospira biflexa serovar Patoc strain 'Patoc 1 (Ames)']|uniref:N-(5'-phosphoribosyl)anthranilate isomerase n=1 Tax=Leptospira biflexa serovar Patoc (strain Patoc 1 / ATCC 23582 / Paris) TaxID=456481 RepID=B0SLQ9_LEPBP|nr:phosphoribosylanthranilate isomerase [Leptospira biflexa]ABZ93336.1 Phosphoribosylanthranilate isomerase [Leptospira biflexa serovar Patoc strain 'Patoc 1 (Ames)']ABZ96961.1 N-(5'-phosphoribosyl)anthranilate isomerase (PRAI) [Leptospira biflexa serovar Patoc strain 'Patoc 1 (Paris)']TGM38224.1 phosphoribosylanthranilate isomerase [Leptospira biflexa]TGM41555.1 phosphoribosylanthranilate isomerase [Leptospira biflexa]